ncbi:hypothetical protein E4U21_001013 [Claviceps maximensis]|nr:hypothetical protein E4U21_001013 [Claviceps maximensis]
MHRQLFIPARNSRHRIAALSLYRALLRSAGKIAIPKDFQTQRSGNAIQRAVRKRFVDDRPLTSFRLVYASMAGGYKFLSLFSKALDQASPEYAQITSHLRGSQAPQPALSRHDQPQAQRRPAQEPFLVNISQTDSPHYVPSYTLPSKKRALNVCATADGQPFLRLKKPQPPSLSKMIGRKGRLFQKKIQRFVEVDDEMKQDAALEDQWENLVAAQMTRESPFFNKHHAAHAYDERYPTRTYSWGVQLSKLWWEWQLEKMWQDWIARGQALNRFVDEQRDRDQVRKSASSRASSLHGSVNPPAMKSGRTTTERTSTLRPNVSLYAAAPFPLSAAIDAQLREAKILPPKTEVDPFLGPRWNALVRSQTPRLAGWVRAQAQKRDR